MEQKSNTRKKIEVSIEHANEERKLQLFNQRLEIAQAGIDAYQKHQSQLATKYFLSYLKRLEEAKVVESGGLTPSHFDTPDEKKEIMMVSGVYWMLVKIFDKTRTEARHKDLKGYLEKLLLFTKGQPFQHVCAENMRKYLQRGAVIHRSDFNRVHQALGGARCFIATSVIEYLKPISWDTLQGFRDQVLLSSFLGRFFISFYYLLGPVLAFFVQKSPQVLRRQLAKTLDFFSILLIFIYGEDYLLPGRKKDFSEHLNSKALSSGLNNWFTDT